MSAKAPFETHHHIVPIRTYFLTICALVVLMAATVLVAEYVQFPSVGPISGTILNQAFALLIAVSKAFLVVTIFMGVRWATELTKFWAILGFAWLSFFGIMAGDYATRGIEDVQGWDKTPATALPRVHQEDVTEPGQMGAPGVIPAPNDTDVRPRQ